MCKLVSIQDEQTRTYSSIMGLCGSSFSLQLYILSAPDVCIS